MREELIYLRRYDNLRIPKTPFTVHDRSDARRKVPGKEWGTKIIFEDDNPMWVTNIPREFYDFEDFEKGKWDNYDLLLPCYGEVLSGSRREWEYNKVAKKMERDGVRKENYELLLKLAEREN